MGEGAGVVVLEVRIPCSSLFNFLSIGLRDTTVSFDQDQLQMGAIF